MFNLASGRATILVADDDEVIREILSEILVGEGYRVICAEDGDQALHAIVD
jgi:CheY-like chemotaxis protein